MTKNPFSPRHPVNPDYFVNRKGILEAFRRHLLSSAKTRPPKPDNISLLGNWGIGKTSMLRKFEDITLGSQIEDIQAFTAFIELSPECSRNLPVFLDRTIDEIERSFATRVSVKPKLRKEIKNWRISSIKAFGLTLDKKSKETLSPITSFEDALRDLWRTLQNEGIDVAVLMYDDIHYLAKGSHESLYDLRSIFQRLPFDGCNYMVAITGKENLFGQVREFAEPFTRFFDRHYLELFNGEETERAIRLPLQKVSSAITIASDVIDRIYELTMGHPFFIHFIMHDLVDFVGEGTVNINEFESHWDKIWLHLEKEKFLSDYNSASDNEKKLLAEIAGLDEMEFSPSDLKWRSGKSSMLARLDEKELLTKHGRGKYSIYHPLFREYTRMKDKKLVSRRI